MTRRYRIALALAVAAVALAAWWGAALIRTPGAGSRGPASHAPGATATAAAPASHAASPPTAVPALPPGAERDEVAIAGRVLELPLQRPVGGAEVVLRGAGGDVAVTTRRDGTYSVRVPAGSYRAFVRDDAVMSIARRDVARLPGLPAPDTVGVPDQALMIGIDARRDLEGIDLVVVRGAVVAGRVVDLDGHPVGGALVVAVGNAMRPTLGTDVAESSDTGAFELRLAPGAFELAATHPRFAGLAGQRRRRYVVAPGDHVDATVVLAAGCVIEGRVIGRGGGRAGDGALERQWGTGDLEFAPAGQIDADGAFHWATTEDVEVTLRAWPWRSPPSAVRRFRCRDGARFTDVVFQIPDRRPDLEGLLVDKAGRPVAFGYLDLRPLDPGGIGQQERADAEGRWQVYSMPPGRYRVIAHADGRGVADTTVVSPRDGIRIELGGTGRLEGTTPRLASGSFEIALERCGDGAAAIPLPQLPRLVTVAGGRFSIDDLPACDLTFSALWRGRGSSQRAVIPAGGRAQIELALGEPRAKTVRGVVRDAAGQPVGGAVVTVVRPDDVSPPAATVADASGAFTIKAFAGASLRAAAGGKVGLARVGGASIDAEQVDIVLGMELDVDVDVNDGSDGR